MIDCDLILPRGLLLACEPLGVLLLPAFDIFLLLRLLFDFLDCLGFEMLDRRRHPAEFAFAAKPRDGDRHIAICQLLHCFGQSRQRAGKGVRLALPADAGWGRPNR